MKKITALIFLALILFVYFYKPVEIRASGFANAYLRLSNQSASSPLSGTVCAQASAAGAGSEAKIAITFPGSFTVSSDPNDWTTNTASLPQGSTPWPGIGATATSVSDKTVIFASDDLTSGDLYCFNFAASSSTTGATGSNLNGALTTKNSSNNTIDSTVYAVAIVLNNQIAVNASVDPQASNLPISIESETAGSPFPQDTTITYKINLFISLINNSNS